MQMTSLLSTSGHRSIKELKRVPFILTYFVFRAYAGDEDGSVYLQAFASFLQDHYLQVSLDRIYLMVKQAMVEAEQVEDYT